MRVHMNRSTLLPLMIWRSVTVVLAASLLQGCLMYSGEKSPNLIETEPAPSLTAAPRIDVIMLHKHTMDGRSAGTGAEDATAAPFMQSFERIRDETPYLKNASVSLAKPELILELDTEVAEHGMVWAMITGATLFIVPGFPSSDVMVDAKLMTPNKEVLASYSAKRELKLIFHIIFLPLTPINFFTSPGDSLYDDTFRDIFIQLEADVKKYSEGA